ncbi:MAG: hypothetical protein JWO99_282 [Candidatus Saccharibacteria bacterium]|nr:hypothetical protein [Candidatus Saccharibacteria bacterium]
MTETNTGSHELQPERIPTFDSFSDVDEALAWVLGRLKMTYTSEGVNIWWNNANLDGVTPEVMWDIDPDKVIQSVAQLDG